MQHAHLSPTDKAAKLNSQMQKLLDGYQQAQMVQLLSEWTPTCQAYMQNQVA